MDRKLLLKMKKYIEKTVVEIDSEHHNRTLKEIIKDGNMPRLYNQILNGLKEP